MSFILDALKKSESDRQQHVAPGIADVPAAAPRRKTSGWVPAIVGLLAINAIGLLFLLLRPDETAVTANLPGDIEAETVAPPLAGDADAGIAGTAANLPGGFEAEAVPPARASEPDAGLARTGAPAGPPEAARDAAPEQTQIAERGATSQPSAPAPATAAPADIPAEETYLTFNDIRASGNANLPDMHIDLHVYSDNAAERFVFINMNQYRENATTSEGPRVRRITPEGVILEYRGSTFLLPRE